MKQVLFFFNTLNDCFFDCLIKNSLKSGKKIYFFKVSITYQSKTANALLMIKLIKLKEFNIHKMSKEGQVR